MKLVSQKMLISDDFLVLCWQYIQSCKNDNCINEFISTILNCIPKYLTTKGDVRGYKQFLVHSYVWFVKDYKNSTNARAIVSETAMKKEWCWWFRWQS